MLRWNYVWPRLLTVVAGWIFLAFGVDPLIHRTLQATGEAALGARVDIGRVRSSLRGLTIELHNVAAADCNEPMKNIVQFDSAVLNLDGRELMKRRYVVNRATLSGLAFQTDRETSGAIKPRERESSKFYWPKLEPFEQAGVKWLDILGDKLLADLDSDFQSFRVAKELAERWPAEYAKLESRLEDARARIDRLRDAVDQMRANPVREIAFYKRQIEEVESLRREIPDLRAEFDRLVAQIEDDRKAIATAKQHDVDNIRRRLRTGPPDAQQLTEYLLGNELIAQLDAMRDWVRRARDIGETVAKSPNLNDATGRGVSYSFVDGPQPASLLVRHLAFDGRTTWSGREMLFAGQAQGLTPQPRRYGRPTLAHFRTTSAIEANVWLMADHTSDESIERLLVDCPRIVAPARTIGKPEHLAFNVPKSAGRFWMQLELRRQEVSGQIIWKQDEFELRPAVGDRLGGEWMQPLLVRATEEIDHLHCQVQLSGELRKPRCRVQSNLGPQLSTGLAIASREELARRRDELLAQADQRLAAETVRLNDRIEHERQRLQEKLDRGEQQLIAYRDELLQRAGLDRISQIIDLPGLSQTNLPQADLSKVSLPTLNTGDLPSVKGFGTGAFNAGGQFPKLQR